MGMLARSGRRPGERMADQAVRDVFPVDANEATRFTFVSDGVPDLATHGVEATTRIPSTRSANLPVSAPSRSSGSLEPHALTELMPVQTPESHRPLDSPTTAMRRTVLPPVFVDESGKRRRWLTVAGATIAAACAAYIAIAAVSMLHGGSGSVGDALVDLLPDAVAGAASPAPTAETAATQTGHAGESSSVVSVAQPVASPSAPAIAVPTPTTTTATAPRTTTTTTPRTTRRTTSAPPTTRTTTPGGGETEPPATTVPTTPQTTAAPPAGQQPPTG